MSNQKFFKGIIIGAVVGGLVSLFDRETRHEVTDKLKTTGKATTYYAKHPSDAMHDLGEGYRLLSTQMATGVNSTLHLLSQLQDLLDTINSESEKNKSIE